MSVLTNNRVNCFVTRIDDVDSEGNKVGIIDASEFIEATYRIFAGDLTTVLVEGKLSTGEIVVESQSLNGGSINIFKTTLSKAAMMDTILPKGMYTHQFNVTNEDNQEIPPVFQELVEVVRAHEPSE